MDRKRKSVSDISLDRDVPGKKLKPQHDEPGKEYSSQPSLTGRECKLPGDHFSILSHGIINSLRRLENGSINVNPDIMKAATELHKTLTADQSPSDRTDASMNALGCRPDGGSPRLPPILDKKLEKSVFTHPAMSNDLHATYDRLEILGDAYLELIATKLIWDRCEGLSSGRISQIRELLVNNETLAGFASQYGLDKKASVPRDSLSQPRRWTKIKGDIFEAYVAAVILSDPTNGYWKAETWLNQLWQPTLSRADFQQPILHAKEDLAKRIMGKNVKLKYIDEKASVQHGKGRQTFFIGVYLTGWGWDNMHLGSGQGPNKVVAGNQAALDALQNHALISEIAKVKRANEASKSNGSV